MTPALPRPDFLRPVARAGWLAWAWCGTGLLVLAAAVADAHTTWQQRSQALARVAGLAPAAGPGATPATAPATAPGATPATAPAAPPARAASAPAAALARRAEAERWLQQLAQPWPAVWAANELAPAGIHWLVLEHGSTGGLRLTGLAADLAPAQAAADALRAQQHRGRPLWQGVVLASVERVPDGQRFEVQARLAPSAVAP